MDNDSRPVVDPELDHQVVLVYGNSAAKPIVVSCNCRTTIHRGHKYHEAMGVSSNELETFDIYNTPSNHNKPFDVEKDGIGRRHPRYVFPSKVDA